MSTTLQSKINSTIKTDIAQESRTFLRWINSKLKTTDKTPISDLINLSDGIILLDLLETLSGQKIGNKLIKINSKLHKHHLERVELVLNSMRTEHIETFRKIGERSHSISMNSFIDHTRTVTCLFVYILFSFFFCECFVIIVFGGIICLDPSKIVSGDIETILAVLWSLIWHYSIASTIFESQQINNTTDLYESKKHR